VFPVAGKDVRQSEAVASIGGVERHQPFSGCDHFAVNGQRSRHIGPRGRGPEEDFHQLDTGSENAAGFASGRIWPKHIANGLQGQLAAADGFAPFAKLHLTAAKRNGIGRQAAEEPNIGGLFNKFRL
jgi:hypothetical protein